ncbi:MAG TPA: hypothetical protein VGS21_05445 [Acidimicrobiales bacterium]|nr:hypothetical protein [Acidimicrobiales bacterium]
MLHELWVADESQTFCLAGPMGDQARQMLDPGSRLTWTVEASSHFEAMTLYYRHMGWRIYTSDYEDIDRQTYAERGWEAASRPGFRPRMRPGDGTDTLSDTLAAMRDEERW